MSIIERVVRTMDLKHLNQTELCRILQITNSTFSSWKTRGTDPPAKYLILICDFLGVSIDYLLGRTNEPNTSNTSQLTQNEQELLDIFKNFSERDQIKILGKMEEWISTSRRENINSQRIVGTQVARRTDHKFVKKPVTAEELEKIKALPEDTDY